MSSSSIRLFVLDTSVLLHDPTAIYRFKEHDIYLPTLVLEELDAAQKGTSDFAQNARQASRFLEQTLGSANALEIEQGLSLDTNKLNNASAGGRLFFQTPDRADGLSTMPNSMIEIARELSTSRAPSKVVLVTKDINLRIRAQIMGIAVEDYYNDKIIDDADLLTTGVHQLSIERWQALELALDSDKECDPTVTLDSDDLFPNEGLADHQGDIKYQLEGTNDASLKAVPVAKYYADNNAVWGIKARNSEQNFALGLLMDPAIEFVSLLGVAGTGKTLLALAAGLAQCLDAKHYREIIMTRETVSVGEDIGFLPGSEEEKMTPWMGALLDNLEVLMQDAEGGAWGRAASSDLVQQRIKIRSLSFMRGRTFLNRYIIIDEAQNLTAKQMRTLITRAGPGTKIVCLGNISQIDTPYLSETTSGLTFVVDRFRRWQHSGHVTLMRGERSRLAEFATENL